MTEVEIDPKREKVYLYKNNHYTLISELTYFNYFNNLDKLNLNTLYALREDKKANIDEYIMKSSYLLFKYLSRMNLVKRFTN